MALIHQFPLTSNGNDVIGGIVSTNNGGVLFSPTNGASFNGINQSLRFYKSLTSPFSMTIWIKFNNTTQDCRPFCTTDSSSAGPTGLTYQGTPTNNGTEKAILCGYSCGSINGFTSTNYPNNSFVLCTLTWNGSLLSLYRGDFLVASETRGNNPIYPYFAIGKAGFGDFGFLNGYAKDARIYSHTLTPIEVADIFNAGANGGSTSTQSPQAYAGGI